MNLCDRAKWQLYISAIIHKASQVWHVFYARPPCLSMEYGPMLELITQLRGTKKPGWRGKAGVGDQYLKLTRNSVISLWPHHNTRGQLSEYWIYSRNFSWLISLLWSGINHSKSLPDKVTKKIKFEFFEIGEKRFSAACLDGLRLVKVEVLLSIGKCKSWSLIQL